MNIKEDLLTDEGKIICELTNIFTNKNKEIDRLNNLNKQLVEECQRLDDEETRLNNILDELEKDIKNLYTYGIKNNAEQRDYLLNRLESLKALKENNK